MSQLLGSWISVRVVGPDTGRRPLPLLAAALPLRWWHTPGQWSDGIDAVPATEFTVAPDHLSDTLQILRSCAEVVASEVPPTLLADSLNAGGSPGWTALLTAGSDRLAHASWSRPETLMYAELAALWDGLGGSTRRRARGITHQLHWLGAAVERPADGPPTPVDDTALPAPWSTEREVPLELVVRLAHLQAVRVRAATGLGVEAEVHVLRSLLSG